MPLARARSQAGAAAARSLSWADRLTFSRPARPSPVLTLFKSWVRPDAFQALINERSVRWYNACLRITRDKELAADAVQEALSCGRPSFISV